MHIDERLYAGVLERMERVAEPVEGHTGLSGYQEPLVMAQEVDLEHRVGFLEGALQGQAEHIAHLLVCVSRLEAALARTKLMGPVTGIDAFSVAVAKAKKPGVWQPPTKWPAAIREMMT